MAHENLQPPTSLVVHRRSRVLEVGYADGASHRIPFELMRVYSPSAEVQGHGPGQAVLQTGKREVEITALEPVGAYGVQPRFSDGHETGIYTWSYLRELGARQQALWSQYEQRLAEAGVDRDAPMGGVGGVGGVGGGASGGGHACGTGGSGGCGHHH